MRITILAMLLLSIAATAWSVEGASLALGETLFKASTLGNTGKSCATCHPAGKGLEEIGSYEDDQLKEMINFCIRDALKGEMMPLDSQELEAMLLYLRRLPTP